MTAGSLDVYDSSTDAGSGDPVITRIAPLPAEIPSSATIGPVGGSIRSTDGRLTLKIPAGALGTSTSLSIGNAANGAPQGVGSGYTVTPGGLSLAKPALLVLNYGSTDTEGSSPESLGLAFQSGGKWYVGTGGSADTVASTVTISIPSTATAGRAAGSGPPEVQTDPLEVSPFVSLQMLPKRAAVRQECKVQFRLWMTGPSSSEAVLTVPAPELLPSFVPPGGLYSWYVSGVLLGDNRVGYLTETGPGSEYTAPSCNPVVNPVRVAVRVIDPADPYARHHSPQALVRVVPPDWKVRLEQGVEIKCPNSPYSYKASSRAIAEFRLDIDLSADSDADTIYTESEMDKVQATKCPMEVFADSYTIADYVPAKIKAFRGAFSIDDWQLHVTIYYTTTARTALTMHVRDAKGVVHDIPVDPGAPGTDDSLPVVAQANILGYEKDLSFTSDPITNILKVSVDAVLESCH